MTISVPNKRLLIVEDELMIAMMLEDMVTELGYEVAAVASKLDKAMDIVASDQVIDAALLDVNLNGQTSFPLAAKLAERNIPFVFTTGYADVSIDGRFTQASILQKPFDMNDLTKKLSSLFPS